MTDTAFGRYLVCEMTDDGEVLFILDYCDDRDEALARVAVHREAPAGSLLQVTGPLAIYERIAEDLP